MKIKYLFVVSLVVIVLFLVACQPAEKADVPEEEKGALAGQASSQRVSDRGAAPKTTFCVSGLNNPKTCSIVFQDSTLENKVKSALKLSSVQKVTLTKAQQLTSLNVGEEGIISVGGLDFFSTLTTLHLYGNSIVDVTSLSGLTQLQTLSLAGNKVSDITALSNLKGLKKLYLQDNQISDLSPLKGMMELEELGVYGNNLNLSGDCATSEKMVGKEKIKEFLFKCLPFLPFEIVDLPVGVVQFVEDCTNGKDDTGDGKVDCADPMCAGFVGKGKYNNDVLCVQGVALECAGDKEGSAFSVLGVYTGVFGGADVLCYNSGTAENFVGGWAECDTDNTQLTKGSGVVFNAGKKINVIVDAVVNGAKVKKSKGDFLCVGALGEDHWSNCNVKAAAGSAGGLACYKYAWTPTKDVAAKHAGTFCTVDADCLVPELRCYNLRGNVGVCDVKEGDTIQLTKAQAAYKDLILYGDTIRIKTAHGTYWKNAKSGSIKVGSITVPGKQMVLATETTADQSAEFKILTDDGKASGDLVKPGDLVVLSSVKDNYFIGVDEVGDLVPYATELTITSTTSAGKKSRMLFTMTPAAGPLTADINPTDILMYPQELEPYITSKSFALRATEKTYEGKYVTTVPTNQGDYGGDVQVYTDKLGSWEKFAIERVK